MVKFLKPNKAVVLLQGRFAGHKAVIVRNFDDGNRDRPYSHCLVAGLAKYPKKVIRKDSAKKTAKKSRVKAFLKVVNYSHIMPTRYTLDVDLKDIVSVDALQSRDKKVTAAKETKARFEDRFKSGKNRWFFSKLSEMALRGAWQLQKLVLSFSDLGGSSRGIRLRNSLGRKVVKLKTRHVAKHPSVQGLVEPSLRGALGL
ncbi:60s ribosomal protein l27-3 [Quercus suber]|uniref:60s ribosomal protein l27-3 n=1 Tax=Quercus suber TaxID=58331 RepID=A0AAW0JZX1_QUESU